MSAQTLLLFLAACVGLMVSPGPNMALVVSHAVAHGARGGVAVATGIVVADLVLTALVMAGIAAFLAAWPQSLDAIRFAGAAYLMWLARQSLRRGHGAQLPSPATVSTCAIVQRSMLTSLLNPKALLFFMVFLPQFVEPERGQVPLQLGVLGALLAATAFVFHALLGVMSAKARGWAEAKGSNLEWIGRLQAALFLGLALRLLVIESAP